MKLFSCTITIMQSIITNFFIRHNRKESMLLSMFYAYFFMLSIFIIISLWIGQYQDVVINFITIILSVVILKKYQQSKNLRTTAIWILILMEIHSGIMIGSNHPDNVSIIFPFIFIAPFFFFFTMKEALWATLIQFFYWGVVTAITLTLHPEFHVLITPIAYINNMNVTFIVMAIGIFYQLITEISYKKLQQADEEKEQLLQIIHHKIRNNLNFVSSLLGLQIRHIHNHPEQDNIEILKDTKGRIQSMALSHNALYDANDIIHIESKKYIQNLMNIVSEIYKTDVKLRCKTNNIYFLEETTHKIGLILNELFNRSLKNSTQKREIVVDISQKGEEYLLLYQDKDLNIKIQEQSFGERLINIIAEDMDAKIETQNNKGMMYKVRFNL